MESEEDKQFFGKLKAWYDGYVASFASRDTALADAVLLKKEHTKRVCHEMELLCDSLELAGHERMLAVTVALLHDVARFEQFRQYRTFSDQRSVNHAELGLTIIDANHLLAELSAADVARVRDAVRYHNAVAIPTTLSADTARYCQLIRDADKLDIYSIALNHYINPNPARSETVQVGIPNGEVVSEEVCASVMRREFIEYGRIKTLADFKIIQLGWVFDLNFIHSIRCVRERGIVEKIENVLPAVPQVREIVDFITSYIDSRLADAATVVQTDAASVPTDLL